MVKNFILAGLVIGFAIFVTIGLEHYFKSDRGEFLMLEQGQKVSDFSFDGQTLYDVDGDTIIIHFWATWCAPCVVEFPELIALANKNKDIQIIAFSSDRTQEAVDRFLQKNKFDIPDNFKIILDNKRHITNGKFSVYRLPESFVLDKNYILQDHIVGAYTGWENL